MSFLFRKRQRAELVERKDTPRYWWVIIAQIAKHDRYSDIGDIREIDDMGELLSVESVGPTSVQVTTRQGETHIIGDAFVSLPQAQVYAQQVILKEIERLERKYDQLTSKLSTS